jgi:G patch domain-containing protein 1
MTRTKSACTHPESFPVADPGGSSVARALEASMLPAAKDSAGARILKKMGWRIGQGIGPRVTLRQRKLQDMQALSGRRVLGADIVIPDDHEEANKHTYAPRDTPILVVERKDNSHGLGYHPGMGLAESVGGKSGGVSGPKLAGRGFSINNPSSFVLTSS